jgi:hypothetical protein
MSQDIGKYSTSLAACQYFNKTDNQFRSCIARNFFQEDLAFAVNGWVASYGGCLVALVEGVEGEYFFV